MALKDITDFHGQAARAWAYIEQHNIRVLWRDLEPPENGFYSWHPGARPCIVLANRLKADPLLMKCTLWEELGHHVTATEEMRRQPFILYCTSGWRVGETVENQALRWASLHLVTETEIRWWLDDGAGTIEEFARRFAITEEMAFARLNALQAHNPSLWGRIMDFMADRGERDTSA
ncbi:MAG TPA: ImmA/IrrE family metallo-endopeptidase [Chloroflexia bacterium]|nr:ImmA/IrrE family metallo-endopeptidase [Chloroflexia bacterium]